MGRPSIAQQRRRQILQATLRTIARHGLAGATLDRIADEAGMARGHVRHFAGNRDDVLAAAAVLLYYGREPNIGSGRDEAAPGGSFLPAATTTVNDALDYLFGDFSSPGLESTAAFAFVDAARSNGRIRGIVIDAYLSSQAELEVILEAAHTQATRAERANVAYGILTIAIGNVFMADLEVSAQRNAAARRSAELLIDTLSRKDD